ncbi:hypothetical protein GQ457_08G014260 [Hibiscus cannabinus]
MGCLVLQAKKERPSHFLIFNKIYQIHWILVSSFLWYLGISLVTRRLTEKDCTTLIEKSRQVVQSKGVIQQIERLCMRLFWKGQYIPASGARVSWRNICSPKNEGGLGVRDLYTWNKACLIHIIKNLLSNEGRIWDEKHRPKVRWHRLVWFGFNVPKHSVVLWMSILDRLQGMRMILKNHCILCEAGTESRNHLFTDCLFSRYIWNSILGMCSLTRRVLDWEGELN